MLGDARVVGLPVLPLGEGTNVLFVDDFPGLVVRIALSGVEQAPAEGGAVTVTAAAGENWPALVRRTVEREWYGLQNLTDIPGSVGAAPVQNIGAYGAELADVLTHLTAYDLSDGNRATIAAVDCEFGYRTSFLKAQADRRVVTSVSLRLQPRGSAQLQVDYPGVTEALRQIGADQPPSSRQLSAAIARLRARKLPDPAVRPNAGSFFKNPVVASSIYERLRRRFDAPGWPRADGAVKLSAAWLIDQSGLRGRSWGAVSVSAQHALVLINEGCRAGGEVVRAADAIRDEVEGRFGVRLENEVRIIDAGSVS